MSKTRELAIEIRARDAATRVLKHIGAGFRSMERRVVASARRISRHLFSLKSALLGLGLGLLARDTIKTMAAWEDFELQLISVTGSAKRAREVFEETAEFAAKTPFQIEELVAATAQLEIFGIGGVKNLRKVGDASAGMKRDILDVVAAVKSLETEPLRNLGLEVKRAGDTMTVTFRDKFGKEVTRTIQGSATEMRQFIVDILGTRFEGGMRRLSGGWSGMVSNLMDWWSQFQNMIGKAGLFEFMKRGLSKVLDKIEELKEKGKLDEWAKTTSDAIILATKKSIDIMADATKAMKLMVGFIEKHPTIAKWGVIGWFLLGSLGVGIAALAAFVKEFKVEIVAGIISGANRLIGGLDRVLAGIEKFAAAFGLSTKKIQEARTELKFLSFDIENMVSNVLAGKDFKGGMLDNVWEKFLDLWERVKARMLPEATGEGPVSKAIAKVEEELRRLAGTLVTLEGLGGPTTPGPEPSGEPGEQAQSMFAPFKEEADRVFAHITKGWDTVGAAVKTVSKTSADFAIKSYDRIMKGASTAFARMVVFGDNFGKSMKQFFKGLLADFIAMVTEMIARWLVVQAVQVVLSKVGVAGQAMVSAATTAATAAANALAAAYWSAAAGLAAATAGASAGPSIAGAAAVGAAGAAAQAVAMAAQAGVRAATHAQGAASEIVPSFAAGTGPAGLPSDMFFRGHQREIVLSPTESDRLRRGQDPFGRQASNRTVEINAPLIHVEGPAVIDRESLYQFGEEIREVLRDLARDDVEAFA